MKMKSVALVCMALTLAVFLGGCGCFYQSVKGETPPPPAPAAQVTPAPEKKEIPVAPAPVAPAPAPAPVAVADLKDINFDFDKYSIRPRDAEILKGNYAWFKANQGKRVRIEGNCDERGSVEYNLALGQKRADSTKNYLVALGVDGKTMETLSYGKDRPVCTQSNEDCWAKNRRSHFMALP
jgi:peptidoglycan-associated lipoprotein